MACSIEFIESICNILARWKSSPSLNQERNKWMGKRFTPDIIEK